MATYIGPIVGDRWHHVDPFGKWGTPGRRRPGLLGDEVITWAIPRSPRLASSAVIPTP